MHGESKRASARIRRSGTAAVRTGRAPGAKLDDGEARREFDKRRAIGWYRRCTGPRYREQWVVGAQASAGFRGAARVGEWKSAWDRGRGAGFANIARLAVE